MARVLKKNSLRTKLETPDVYDKDARGNIVYPQTAEGTAGDAYTYNTDHMGDPPPAQEVEEPDDDTDWEEVAAAAALALAAKRHKDNLKKAADTEHERLDAAAKVQHKRLAAAAKAEHKNLADAAKRTHKQINDANAAQARLAAAALDAQTTGQGPIMVPEGIASVEPGRAPLWEDFTNMPLEGQEIAGGYVADSPTGNDYAVASGPLPSGVEEGAHSAGEASPYAGEHTHEGLMISARHARQQARGAANQSLQRRQTALGLIGERRAKGLPTETLEREAGWAYQQEQRARGMEQENARIEIGQRYREMEDIGAERAQEQLKAGAEYTERLQRDAERAREMEKEALERKEQAERGNVETATVAVTTADQVLTPETAAHLPQGPGAPDQPTTTAIMQEGAPPELDPVTRRVVSAGGPLPPRRNAQQEQGDNIQRPAATVASTVPQGDMYGIHPILPSDANFQAGRPTMNEWDTAYQLNFNAEEEYNRREDEIAARQNQIQQDDDNDPMRSEQAQTDANAPFRESPPLAPAEAEAEQEAQQEEDRDKQNRDLELQAAIIEASRKPESDIPDQPEPPAPK